MGKHSTNRSGMFGRGSGPGKPSRRVPGSVQRREANAAHKARGAADPVSLSDPASRRKGPLESAPARLKAERDRRKRRAKRIIVTSLVAVALLLVGGAAGAFAYVKHIESTMQRTIVKQEELQNALTKAKPQEPFTMLMLGADYRPGEIKYRTDVMILVKVDPQTKKVWMISIPRDTKVNIPGHGNMKINAAHFIGGEEGPAYAVKAVEDLTGVPVNHYMEVNFRGFKKVVDALGGVWVDVPVEIDDVKADYSPGHRAKHIDPGYQLLDGEHALTFVRSRKFPDGDFTRMAHQQIFFRALADQMASMDNVARLPRLVSSAAQFIKTDMSLIDLIRTAQALKGAGSKNLYTASLKGEWKSPFVYLDEDLKDHLIGDLKAGRSFEDSPTAPAAGAATTGAKPGQATQSSAQNLESTKPAEVSVTIRNGAGIAGCAKQAASIVKARGYDVAEMGNANQFVYDKTLVVYTDNKAAAQALAAILPPGAKLVESRGMYSFDTDVLIVVGKDWDVSKVPVTPVTSQ